jgi:hypothetical protein
VPILLICYKLAISKTLAEYKIYNMHIKNGAITDSEIKASGTLASQHEKLNQILNSYKLDTTNQQKNLLGLITELCYANDLQLKDYRTMGISQQDSIKLLTRVLSVEGNFIDCVRMIYVLETQQKLGRVSSVQYNSYTEGKEKNIHLICTVYIQNIINTEKN